MNRQEAEAIAKTLHTIADDLIHGDSTPEQAWYYLNELAAVLTDPATKRHYAKLPPKDAPIEYQTFPLRITRLETR